MSELRSWNPDTHTKPSWAVQRGKVEHIGKLLGVPECGLSALDTSIRTGQGNVLFIGPNGHFGATEYFAPEMVMSYSENGQDFVVPNTVPTHSSRGTIHIVSCENMTVYIGHFNSCGNLARLERIEPPPTRHFDDGFHQTAVAVSEPGTMALLALGVIAAWICRVRRR